MNWEAIGATGEIVGAIAVVVTLIYLATQIRQNTRQLASASLQGLADRAENRLLLVASSPEFAKVGVKLQQDPDSLSAVETAQLYGWIGAWITDLEETYRQFKLGTVSSPTMEARVRAFLTMCEMPLVRVLWGQTRDSCESEFADWLEPQLSE